MKTFFEVIVTSTLLMFLLVGSKAEEGEKKKITQLQIGVKERVPESECTQKSQKGEPNISMSSGQLSLHVGDTLHMHYTGTLYDDGSEFDSSLKRGKPFTFPLGAGRVIKGWDQGLMGMCVGEKRRLVIPPHLGYGARGSPPKVGITLF